MKVLIVVGEYLGHWGRCLLIADALRRHKSAEVVFAGRDSAGNLSNLTQQYNFPMIFLGNDRGKDPLMFADRLEATIQHEQPDLIFLDIGLIPWIVFVRFPDTPVAVLSHYFLTSLCPEVTMQKEHFANNKDQWNQIRVGRGLDPLESADDIFGNSLVLLADPEPVIPHIEKIPENFKAVGAIVWEPSLNLPPELEDARDILYVSIGSSGKAIPCHILEALKDRLNAGMVVIAHPVPSIFTDIHHHDFKIYHWLPGKLVLTRSMFAVTQGGAGSTYQALQSGVPVGCWPFQRNHVILSQRIEALGAGVLLDGNDWKNQIEDIHRKYQSMLAVTRNLKMIDTPSAIQKVLAELEKFI